ncbi:MAG: DUF4380 domain-containing protein [Cellvibrionaceae bacterium]
MNAFLSAAALVSASCLIVLPPLALSAQTQQSGHGVGVQPLSIESMELASERLSVTIDPSVGGRVSSLRYKDRQLLFSRDEAQSSNNWGSTFWLSPQSLWGWPPVEAHDSAPYQVSQMHENSVSLVSQWGMGAQVQKRMSLDEQRSNVLRMDYTVETREGFGELAGWEITRIPRRGLVFYPAQQSSLDVAMGAVVYRHRDDVVWLELKPDIKPPEGKINANGDEGWLAWIEDDLLYLKLYQPVEADRMASGEGDVEVYLSPRQDYIELEVQSAARSLASGDQLKWRVSWLVEELPAGVEAEVGNRQLLAWVREQAQAAR